MRGVKAGGSAQEREVDQEEALDDLGAGLMCE